MGLSGAFVVDVAASIVKKIRNRPKAVARRAAKAAQRAERRGELDEVAEDFNIPTDEVPTMNMALLLPILGSIARTFLPAATAYLAGLGINVGADNPLVIIAIAVVVYGGAQVWSILRKVNRAKASE
jgi:hypothetical protein